MKREWWKYALLALLALFGFWLVAGILSSGSTDAELAKTVREALHMARQAHREADAARRGGSAFRLITMAVGMAGPLIVVYLIYRLHVRSEPQGPEIPDVIERERLGACEEDRPELPPPALRLPEEITEAKQADQD